MKGIKTDISALRNSVYIVVGISERLPGKRDILEKAPGGGIYA